MNKCVCFSLHGSSGILISIFMENQIYEYENIVGSSDVNVKTKYFGKDKMWRFSDSQFQEHFISLNRYRMNRIDQILI